MEMKARCEFLKCSLKYYCDAMNLFIEVEKSNLHIEQIVFIFNMLKDFENVLKNVEKIFWTDDLDNERLEFVVNGDILKKSFYNFFEYPESDVDFDSSSIESAITASHCYFDILVNVNNYDNYIKLVHSTSDLMGSINYKLDMKNLKVFGNIIQQEEDGVSTYTGGPIEIPV